MTIVRFLGSGDAFGSGGRMQTCMLVADAESRCLIDCGATALVAMRQHGIDPASIDAIVISHLHGDHFGGLPFMLLDAQFNSRRSTPLTIAGHADLPERLAAAMEVLFPRSTRALEVVPVDFLTLVPGGRVPVAGASVEVFDVAHFCGSPPFAVRLTTPSGSVIGYSGDTEWTDGLIDAAAGCHLFVAEAYSYDKPIRWHLDYATLLQHRDQLDATHVVVTHLGAEMVKRADTIDLTVAYDGLQITLTPRRP